MKMYKKLMEFVDIRNPACLKLLTSDLINKYFNYS